MVITVILKFILSAQFYFIAPTHKEGDTEFNQDFEILRMSLHDFSDKINTPAIGQSKISSTNKVKYTRI